MKAAPLLWLRQRALESLDYARGSETQKFVAHTLATASAPPGYHSGAQQRGQSRYAEQLQRTETMLKHTSAIAAAVCRADALPSHLLAGFPGRPPPHVIQDALDSVAVADASDQGADGKRSARRRVLADAEVQAVEEATASWCESRTGRRQKVLVGLARATADGTFVATLDEVLVLPQLQSQGLGRRWGCSSVLPMRISRLKGCHASCLTRTA